MSMKYYAIKSKATNMYNAIDICGNMLFNKKCVTIDFSNSCIKRERKYPTGLPGIVSVAIPHCEADKVKQDSICCLILEDPVKFYRMDEPTLQLDVKIVFNIAVSEPDKHLNVLKNLMRICNNKEVMDMFLNLDVTKVPNLMKEELEL